VTKIGGAKVSSRQTDGVVEAPAVGFCRLVRPLDRGGRHRAGYASHDASYDEPCRSADRAGRCADRGAARCADCLVLQRALGTFAFRRCSNQSFHRSHGCLLWNRLHQAAWASTLLAPARCNIPLARSISLDVL
jgi:hypothetical protein